MSEPSGLKNSLRRLAGRRLLARAALSFELLWPAVWPALAVAGVFLVAALLNLPPLLPGWLHVSLLVVVGLAVAGLLFRGLRGVHMPDDRAADLCLQDVGRHEDFDGWLLGHVSPGYAAASSSSMARIFESERRSGP